MGVSGACSASLIQSAQRLVGAAAVRVAGSEAQAGELSLGVQLGSDGVAFGNRQLIGADRGEGVLCVNIKGSNVFFFR